MDFKQSKSDVYYMDTNKERRQNMRRRINWSLNTSTTQENINIFTFRQVDQAKFSKREFVTVMCPHKKILQEHDTYKLKWKLHCNHRWYHPLSNICWTSPWSTKSSNGIVTIRICDNWHCGDPAGNRITTIGGNADSRFIIHQQTFSSHVNFK